MSEAGNEALEGDSPGSKCATPSRGSGGGSAGPQSACEPYRELIGRKLSLGLHGKRIWEDLVEECGVGHGYASVKRFVRKLRAREPERVWRLECLPGKEAQVDHGTLWSRVGGKKRKIHVLRVSLNLVDFIRDIRAEFGKSKLPFSIATTGHGGMKVTPEQRRTLAGQLNVADPKKYPEFAGNVFTIDTRPIQPTVEESPQGDGSHWHNNGKALYLIGKGMGDGMVEMLKAQP